MAQLLRLTLSDNVRIAEPLNEFTTLAHEAGHTLAVLSPADPRGHYDDLYAVMSQLDAADAFICEGMLTIDVPEILDRIRAHVRHGRRVVVASNDTSWNRITEDWGVSLGERWVVPRAYNEDHAQESIDLDIAKQTFARDLPMFSEVTSVILPRPRRLNVTTAAMALLLGPARTTLVIDDRNDWDFSDDEAIAPIIRAAASDEDVFSSLALITRIVAATFPVADGVEASGIVFGCPLLSDRLLTATPSGDGRGGGNTPFARSLIAWLSGAAGRVVSSSVAHSRLVMIELHLKSVVTHVLEANFDGVSKWWHERPSEKVKKKVEERRASGAGPDDPFVYLDFGDWVGIITQEWSLFSPLFGAEGTGKHKAVRWLERLVDIRNRVMHPPRLATMPLTSDDTVALADAPIRLERIVRELHAPRPLPAIMTGHRILVEEEFVRRTAAASVRARNWLSEAREGLISAVGPIPSGARLLPQVEVSYSSMAPRSIARLIGQYHEDDVAAASYVSQCADAWPRIRLQMRSPDDAAPM